MIATVKANNAIHRRFIQFSAVKHGLENDPKDETTLEVIFHDGERLLNVIREAGGRILFVTDTVNVRG